MVLLEGLANGKIICIKSHAVCLPLSSYIHRSMLPNGGNLDPSALKPPPALLFPPLATLLTQSQLHGTSRPSTS